jgi:hypothetical protein
MRDDDGCGCGGRGAAEVHGLLIGWEEGAMGAFSCTAFS